MTLPAIKEGAMRRQVKEGLASGELARKAVEVFYVSSGLMPEDNKLAGLPPSEKIVGSMVSDVKVTQGVVTITYGNNAGKSLEGKKVSLRPAVVPEYAAVPLAWICHDIEVPRNMEARGKNETDIPKSWLPLECRGPEKK